MRYHRFVVSLTALAALVLNLAGAALADDLQTAGDPDSLGFSARRLARITSWFEAQTMKGDPSGFVVGIARGGKLAYLQPTGFEDPDKKSPMRPNSIFRIGSMSKQITSVATMMLVDEGKLDLDAPVARYLPELKDMPVVKKDPASGDAILGELEPAKRAMTIRDLLRNTSGLVYGGPGFADPGFGNAAIHALYGVKAPFRRDKPIAPFVASLGTLPLLHQPGEIWEYSLGYDVLGRVIEVVSGQTFEQFLQTVRLMMTNSMPPDIHFAGHEAGPAYGTGWGLGFAIRTNPDFSFIPGAVGSFNWQGSWGTFFSVDPVQKLILVMMMQRRQHSENGFYFNAIRRLPYAALKVPETPAPLASGPLKSDSLTQYVGRYDFGGSVSSLDRQTSVVNGDGWSGLESVAVETEGLRVIKPADGGPAAKAGVMARDLITAIGDKSIEGLTLEAALRRISGPLNTTIKLKIVRQRQNDPLVVAFAREPVPAHSVELQIRVADDKLVVEATGRWSILDFDKGQPTPMAAISKDEFQVESGDRTRIAFTRDAAGKVNGAVLNPGPWEQRGALAQ